MELRVFFLDILRYVKIAWVQTTRVTDRKNSLGDPGKNEENGRFLMDFFRNFVPFYTALQG